MPLIPVEMAQAVNGRLRKVPAWPVYLLSALPFLWLVWVGFADGLGADPVKFIERHVGKFGLIFLILGLCVTPVRRFTGISLIKYRRAIGLAAFFYVALHLVVWLVLDIQLRWGEIWADIVKRPYITIGMLGFAAMVPLAVTSNNLSLRWMGAAAWGKLHRLTYLAAFAGAAHYLILVKAWPLKPILYFAAVVLLLALRVWWSWARQRRASAAAA
jgi:methionine sulfoxide reductase heme-binding subunit